MQAPATQTSTTNALAGLLPRFMGLVRLAESLAQRFKGAVLFGAATGALAAAWLGYFVAHAWEWSVTAAAIAGLVLAVAALVTGPLYLVR